MGEGSGDQIIVANRKSQFTLVKRLMASFGLCDEAILMPCFLLLGWSMVSVKASFWGLFRANFYGHFCRLFMFKKFGFSKFREKFP